MTNDTSTVPWLPFPQLSSQEREVLIRWLYSAADREANRQRRATRTQDKARHGIRANAFRDAVAELRSAT